MTISDNVSIIQRLLWICNTIFHQVVAIVGTFILWIIFYYQFHSTDPSTTYSLHVILTTLAYVPVMAEAIVLFASENVWTLSVKRTTKYYIHGAMLFLSAILATAGISLMIQRKNDSSPNPKHFVSTHAWTGLVSWIFVVLSQILGLASAKSLSLKNLARPVWFKLIHNVFGILGYIFGIVSLCYGIDKRTYHMYASEEARQAVTVLLGFIGVWTILAALKSAYNQLKTIIA